MLAKAATKRNALFPGTSYVCCPYWLVHIGQRAISVARILRLKPEAIVLWHTNKHIRVTPERKQLKLRPVSDCSQSL
ncbi:hypothetical protein PAL_GLEAN10008990 [Pteropus alecto]|uniref:Uncharacterized protein n=1 Tax=Pteropus alecto TaxID=9402 RepID=L5KJI9_PTEAL|nr:hypothetical protein PAL_GLEAN10008990 [Pteropus alecto]